MHEFPIPCRVAPGPLHFESVWPRDCCKICNNEWTKLRWPLHPHKGSPICLSCLNFGLHRALDCLTTAEARRKYQIKDLSSLQWAPHPSSYIKTRYYRESDLRVLAVRERGGPTGFNSALEDRRAKAIKERRERLVKHYHDLAELGRCFQTQAVLAGLNPTECMDLRLKLENREQELERIFREEAIQQLSILRCLVPLEPQQGFWTEADFSPIVKAKYMFDYLSNNALLPSEAAYQQYKRCAQSRWRNLYDEGVWTHLAVVGY